MGRGRVPDEGHEQAPAVLAVQSRAARSGQDRGQGCYSLGDHGRSEVWQLHAPAGGRPVRAAASLQLQHQQGDAQVPLRGDACLQPVHHETHHGHRDQEGVGHPSGRVRAPSQRMTWGPPRAASTFSPHLMHKAIRVIKTQAF